MCFQSGSSRCSVGAGGCAEYPGTSSWLCLKMFFLEAGSYVLPRRNENKAPKSSLGVRRELCRAAAASWALPARKLRWGCRQSGPWQGTVWGRVETHVLPLAQGLRGGPFPSHGSPARSALLAAPSVPLNFWRGPRPCGKGPGKPGVQILALI